MLAIYTSTHLQSPVCRKSFFKADKIEIRWSTSGKYLLALTQTDIDKTGKSYYGETNLYFLAADGSSECRVDLDKEGPIHDMAWSPTRDEFVVIYGYMPSKVALFDRNGRKVTDDFGEAARNFVQWNPQGRIFCLGGFGNLAGDVEVWSRDGLQKLAAFRASGATSLTWCPDSRHVLIATLSPRLRVDNGFVNR